MDRTSVKITPERSGYLNFEQRTTGWPGSGFNCHVTELRVRRIIQGNLNETQIEITITEFKGKADRRFVYCSSFVLDPLAAKELALAVYPELKTE